MKQLRATRTPLRRALAVGCRVALAFAAALVTTTPAGAAETAAGEPALRQARAAWERSAYEAAEPLYREAIERGGLSSNEVLEGYVRLGVRRTSLGKKEQASRAFKAASVLDASFELPSQAGPKARALADKARKDTAKIGSIQLTVRAPKETPSGRAFKVTAILDRPHLTLVNAVGLHARDGTTGKEVSSTADPDESMELEVPSDVTLPGASILVRVDALDAHRNRLATAEERVHVPEASSAPGPIATSPRPASRITPNFTPTSSGDSARKSIWASPWPYVIGAVVLAGAGTALYFGTRPPSDVTVGQVGVRER